MKLKEFLMKKKLAAGCIAAVAVITAGSLAVVWQDSQVPELPNYTDPVVEQTIEDNDTPLASAPKVTTKTTKNTKTSKKNIKLKTASKKTYTKTLPTKKKTTTKTNKKNNTTTIKTQTTVQTATTQKYTKKSKNVVQTQKITTTVKTTTTVVAAAASSNTTTNASATKTNTAASTATTVKQEKYSISNVASIAPKMDSRVLNAYTKMGFTVTVDPSVSYAGYFNAANRSITLRTEDDTIYHELGHYLAFIAGNVDKSSSFATVYNSEKSKFTGVNKAYATQNASEYFAESVLDYYESPEVLKAQRPKTYEAIQQALDRITDERVDKIIKVYSAVWK